MFVSIPTFVLTFQARDEFLKVEEDLRDAFPEYELGCDIQRLERSVVISFVSAFTFTIPLLIVLLVLLYRLFTGKRSAEEVEVKVNRRTAEEVEVKVNRQSAEEEEVNVNNQSVEEYEAKKKTKYSCYEIFIFVVIFISFIGEGFATCVAIFGLRQDTACLAEDDQFEELATRLRRIIILDSILLVPFAILACCIVMSCSSGEGGVGGNYGE